MRPDPGTPALANMSAPPRSTVMLPRLATSVPMEGSTLGDPVRNPRPARYVPIGAGGGRLLSHALCLARVQLPAAVCAHLQMSYGATQLAGALGLARALVAIARHAGGARAACSRSRAARGELARMGRVPEGELVQELTSRLESVEWPRWVPRVGMATPLGNDIVVATECLAPPQPPDGIACPLLAARVVSAIRGPVFMRDSAPTLTHLLELFGGTTPSGAWELWLPVRPGTVRPASHTPSTVEHAMKQEIK